VPMYAGLLRLAFELTSYLESRVSSEEIGVGQKIWCFT
jgi:hypothetical protein